MYAPPIPVADVERRLAANKVSSARNASPVRRLVGSLGAGIRSRSATLQRSNAHNSMSAKTNSSYPVHMSHLAPPSSPPPSTPPPAAPSGKNRRLEIGLPRASTAPNLPLLAPSLRSPPTTPRRPRGTLPKRPPRPPSELFLPSTPAPVIKTLNPVSRVSQRSFEAPLPPPTVPPPAVPSRIGKQRIVPKAAEQYQKDKIPPLFSQSPNVKAHSPSCPVSAPGAFLPASAYGAGQPVQLKPSASHVTYDHAVAQVEELTERGRERSRQISSSTTTSRAPETLFAFPMVPIVRASTAPPSLDRLSNRARSNLNLGSGPRSPGLKSRHVSKASARSLDTHLLSAGKRPLLTATSLRAALLEFDEAARFKGNAIVKPLRPVVPSDGQATRRRKRKGETMSMLLDTGFFPVKELIYGNGKATQMRESAMYRINLPPRLSFLDGDMPQMPGTTANASTELFQTCPTSPRRSRYRRSGGVIIRSPLTQISENGSNTRDGTSLHDSDQLSPGVGPSLAAIPEDSTAKENTAPASGISTPVATQIHLRGGSVVTVTPPELTAWRASIYLHGPIKLPKPAIIPRKNSVASLAPFQEAVDQVYQHALAIPRRRSDDAVVDDICDFFDDFGFDAVGFGGDELSVALDCLEGEEDEATGVASVVEVVQAKAALAKPSPVPKPPIPPVQTEERLRERGIARLARLSRSSAGSVSGEAAVGRRESFILGDEDGSIQLPLLPAPEESMLEAVLKPPGSTASASMKGGSSSVGYARSEYTGTTGEYSGSGWNDEEVELKEMEGFEAAPISKRGKSVAARRTRNPIKKIKQAVALANTAL